MALVRDHCRWEHAGQPFFSGEVEPCINGRTVTLGIYFDQDVDGVVARLLGEQLEDGGWNCEAENGSVRSSFATTINVLEGLLAHERATGGSAESIAARRRGEEYLLERKLIRRKSTGEVVNPAWLQFSFPTRWHYDVLRALDYFRSVGDVPDSRMDEAIDVLRSKQQPDGTWLLENTHPGTVHFALEDGDGRPSRWNTLRALRVLSWYEQSAALTVVPLNCMPSSTARAGVSSLQFECTSRGERRSWHWFAASSKCPFDSVISPSSPGVHSSERADGAVVAAGLLRSMISNMRDGSVARTACGTFAGIDTTDCGVVCTSRPPMSGRKPPTA